MLYILNGDYEYNPIAHDILKTLAQKQHLRPITKLKFLSHYGLDNIYALNYRINIDIY